MNVATIGGSMNFEQDIRDQVMAELPHCPADAPALRAKHVSDLLITYLNWRDRFIPARSYQVHVSAVLKGKRPLPDAKQEAALDSIIKALLYQPA